MVFANEVLENELAMDMILNIKTNGRFDKYSDNDKLPYEPTLYQVLDVFVDSGFLHPTDNLVDCGCGKGRVAIYLSSKTNCKVLGLEYVKELYQEAITNAGNACVKHRATFIHTLAEEYIIKKEDNCFYFANPFSVNILSQVLKNIFESVDKHPRKVKLYFHYMSNEYAKAQGFSF